MRAMAHDFDRIALGALHLAKQNPVHLFTTAVAGAPLNACLLFTVNAVESGNSVFVLGYMAAIFLSCAFFVLVSGMQLFILLCTSSGQEPRIESELRKRSVVAPAFRQVGFYALWLAVSFIGLISLYTKLGSFALPVGCAALLLCLLHSGQAFSGAFRTVFLPIASQQLIDFGGVGRYGYWGGALLLACIGMLLNPLLPPIANLVLSQILCLFWSASALVNVVHRQTQSSTFA